MPLGKDKNVDFDATKAVKFSNGITILNVTDKPLVFLDGNQTVTVEPCGVLFPVEEVITVIQTIGPVQFAQCDVKPIPQGALDLTLILQEFAFGEIVIAGNPNSAQAYKGTVWIPVPEKRAQNKNNSEVPYSIHTFDGYSGLNSPPLEYWYLCLFPSPTMTQKADRAQRQALKRHGANDQYIAIFDGTVYGIGKTAKEAGARAAVIQPYKEFIIRKLAGSTE